MDANFSTFMTGHCYLLAGIKKKDPRHDFDKKCFVKFYLSTYYKPLNG